MSRERKCEACSRKMGEGDIRKVDPRTGLLSCTQCVNHPLTQPNKIDVTATKETSMQHHTASWRRVTAHDGGDGQVIRHCFSCGSGGVVGRSDGTCECTVCQTVFTVQVQPRNVMAPQTVNGQPVHIPGMPEESEVAPSVTTAPAEQPGQPQEEAPAPGGKPVVPTISDDDLTEYITASGQRLSAKAYAQYLALGAPGVDRQQVLGRVRTANLKTAQAVDTAYCMRCTEEDLAYGMLCRRPGQTFIDHGPDPGPDLARWEGVCLRCCGHNHG